MRFFKNGNGLFMNVPICPNFKNLFPARLLILWSTKKAIRDIGLIKIIYGGTYEKFKN